MQGWTTSPADPEAAESGLAALGWFWHAITRLGEAQILLPAFLAGVAWLVFLSRGRQQIVSGTIGLARRRGPHAHAAILGSATVGGLPARDAAARWAAGLAAGTLVTTASKIAFIGYGVGSALLDFTGFSGHSMYAAAVLPVLAALVGGRAGAACGTVLALVIMTSRVRIGAHSWSEAIGGATLGLAIAGWTLSRYLAPPGAARAPWWLPLLLAGWLTLLPMRAPPSRTHDWVVRLSLWLSDRPVPYTRQQMLFHKETT